MMFRDYKAGDEFLIDANDFSSFEKNVAVFDDDTISKVTIEDDSGEIMAILLWKEIKQAEFWVCSLVSKKISMAAVRSIKSIFDKMSVKFGAKMCVTYSHENSILERWHRLFGFMKQGQEAIDGVQLNKWVATWE